MIDLSLTRTPLLSNINQIHPHSKISFEGKIIITGETWNNRRDVSVGRMNITDVWEGIQDSENTNIMWNKCVHRKFMRIDHFCLNIKSNLIAIGGNGRKMIIFRFSE